MKKVLSYFLTLTMILGLIPMNVMAKTGNIMFTWAWDKQCVDVDDSITIVSWSGGNNASYRSAFAVFDMEEDFEFDKDITTVKADFVINGATLNNGERQMPTAAVVLVNGEDVKRAYETKNGELLRNAVDEGIFKCTYLIDSDPAQNGCEFDLTDYFEKYPSVESVGIYLTNLESDGFSCNSGIASEIDDITFDVQVYNAYKSVKAVDENGNVFDEKTLKGFEGEEFDAKDVLNSAYYKNGNRYVIAQDAETAFVTETNPQEMEILYVKSNEAGKIYKATNGGYSGVAFREGICVAAGGNDASATKNKAPYIKNVSQADGVSSLGSARIGVLEFEIPADINPAEIAEADIRFYVDAVHENINNKWIRVACYETKNPILENYTLGGMNDDEFLQVKGDYSEKCVYWSKEKVATDNLGWKSVDITDIAVNALDNARYDNESGETVVIVVRIQVPGAAVFIDTPNGKNAPYIVITKPEDYLVAKYDFENLTQDGRCEDISKNNYDALLKDEAKIEDGKLILNGNGAMQIDYEEFRDELESLSVVTNVKIVGNAINNSRIFDFGANSGNSVFLRASEFAAGMKYNNGSTVYAVQTTDAEKPFENSEKSYQIAMCYDAENNKTTVFSNGEKIIETYDITHSPNEFADKTANNFVGRTNWYDTDYAKDNPDIKAEYDDFAVYNSALNERVVYSMYDTGFEKDVENVCDEVEKYISELSKEYITENVDFPSSWINDNGEAFTVEWHVADSTPIDGKGNVLRGFDDCETEVYASVSKGGYTIETESFVLKIKGYGEDGIKNATVLKYNFDTDGLVVLDENGNCDATASDESVQRNQRANLEKNKVIKLPDNINKNVVDYTIACWVRCDDLSLDGQRIYDFGIENGTYDKNYYAFTKVNSNGTLSVGVNNGGNTQLATSNGKLAEGEWAHVAVTYNADRGTTCIYINGKLECESDNIKFTMAGACFDNHSTSNYIGRSQWYLTQSATNPDFKGKMDNFTFLNVTLSENGIEYLKREEYDSPDVDITSAAIVKGLNRAIVKIDSKEMHNSATLVVAQYSEGLKNIGTKTIDIGEGMNSYCIDLTKNDSDESTVKCFVWENCESMKPIAEEYNVTKEYSFNYDMESPDNHLLSNEFSLRAYDNEKYLSIANGVSMEQWSDNNRNLLWTAPYNVNSNAESYYGLKNVNGTYLALDTGKVLTNKINNWRFIRIDPEKTGGMQNVYAIKQRSSGMYLVRDGDVLVGEYECDDESSWWVLDIVNYDTFSQMLVSQGFLNLSANERNRIYGITSQAMWLSSNRRGQLLSYMGSNYENKTADEQSAALKKIFSYVPTQQINREVTKSTTGAHGTYELGEITGSANYKGKDGENLWAYKAVATYYSDTSKTNVEQTVIIYGRNANVIKNIAKGFGYIPYQFRKYIRTIKDYYHTANQFNCGANEMYVRTTYDVSAEQFARTASHEVGHSLSFSWGYVHSSGRYTSAMNSDINKVSGYGNTNSTEDMAEFTQLVISSCGDEAVLKMIKKMYPGRFSVLRAVLNEMNGGNGILKGI